MTNVIDEVSNKLKDFAYDRTVSIEITGEAVMLPMNRDIAYRLIYNLMDNAIRYNKPGGKVIVDVRKENERVMITVSDTGVGISPEHIGRISECFYRVDKSHSKKTGGAGCGLYIVKHVVECQKGHIEIKSAENVGTVVSILL